MQVVQINGQVPFDVTLEADEPQVTSERDGRIEDIVGGPLGF